MPTGLLCTLSQFSLPTLPWWGLSQEATGSQLGQNHVRNVVPLINLVGITFSCLLFTYLLGVGREAQSHK